MHTVEVFATKNLYLTEDIKQTFDQRLDNWKPINFNEKHLQLGIQLGSGGFGSVSECYVNKKRYALKRLHKKRLNEKAFSETLESERIALNLRHPNIVRSILTFQWDNTQCVLMEFVDKKTLQHAIDNPSEVMDNKRRVRITKQIASGLEYAHRQNIAHLDLKPANILMTLSGECKIADFGCCQIINDKNAPSTPTKSSLTGTFAYRAPELLRGETPTVKADIYSLSICLWQMLLRERPYVGEHHQVVIFKVVAYNLRPSLPVKFEKCDEKYTELIQMCWNKEKFYRPSAKQILSYL